MVQNYYALIIPVNFIPFNVLYQENLSFVARDVYMTCFVIPAGEKWNGTEAWRCHINYWGVFNLSCIMTVLQIKMLRNYDFFSDPLDVKVIKCSVLVDVLCGMLYTVGQIV